MDSRGLTSVVSKTLEIGIVILYIGLVTAVLYGGMIPSYTTATGEEIGDRVLTTAAERVRQSVPQQAWHVSARYRVELPQTIRGETYSIRARNRTLVLDHPHPSVGGRIRLVLPRTVSTVEGEWRSHETLVIRVVSSDTGLRVTLEGEP